MSNTPVMVELSTGKSIPLRPARAKKSGNEYHAIINPNTGNPVGGFGIKVAPSVVGSDLPEHVVVNGVTFKADRGTTQGGAPKVVFTGKVTLPEGERNLFFQVSKLTDDKGKLTAFNVIGRLARDKGRGGAAPVNTL